MARNPISRGGKRWAVEFENLKDVQLTFQRLSGLVQGITGLKAEDGARRALWDAFIEVSEFLRDNIKAAAAARNAPKRVQAAVFAFTDITKGRTTKKERSTLVGIRKGAPPRRDNRIYVEWSGRGKTLGMSLATIFNKGTSRGIKPGRFFQRGLFSSKSLILSRLTAAYKTAIESLNR